MAAKQRADPESLRRRRDEGEGAFGVSAVGIVINFVSVIITWVAIFSTSNALGRNGIAHVVNAPKLGIAKAVLDPVIGSIMFLVTFYTGIMSDGDTGRPGWTHMGTVLLAGLSNIVVAALTILAFFTEGESGIVGSLEGYGKAIQARGGGGAAAAGLLLISASGNQKAAYITGATARGNLMRTWFASGVFEAIVGIFYLVAAILLLRTKWRNR